MSRLPTIGGDDGQWGTILNDYLGVSHEADGTLKTTAVPAASTAVAGITRLATTAEAQTGTSATIATTPAGVKTVADTKVTNGGGVTAIQVVSQAPATGSQTTGTLYVVQGSGASTSPVALTDATTITTDVSTGSYFRVSIAGNRTLAAPTNPTDGLRVLWEVTASGANRTLALATDAAGAFKFGTSITTIPVITSGTTTFLGAVYRTASTRWHVLAVSSGH